MLAVFANASLNQDKPEVIPAGSLPKTKQECVICEIEGQGHGLEKPFSGAKYKGKSYFFCAKGELEKFMEDPEAYMKLVLPMPMYDFDRPDLDGKVWNKESFKGKVVLVDFWATWCAPCKKNKPIEAKIQTKFGGDKFTVLAVSIDEQEKTVRDYLKKNKFNFPVIHDSETTWQNWKVRVVPSLFLVKDGMIIKTYKGEIKQSLVEKDIADALK